MFCLVKCHDKIPVIPMYRNCKEMVVHMPGQYLGNGVSDLQHLRRLKTYVGASWLLKMDDPQMPPRAPAEIIAAATTPFFSGLAVWFWP